ncbi:MAG TPA: glutamine synthetase family protein [Acidimicrobiales bacterium]|nr:glutamine synthetase family protein [Acidimicrobiales bacterium]
MARAGRRTRLDLDELSRLVSSGDLHTVVLAACDMQGRLQGKRCHARYFLDEVVPHRAEACNYLLAVDVDMRTVDGYEMSSWERGYGDFVMRPDLSTLRLLPWHPGTALCLADLEWEDASPVVASPRQVLRAQLDRLSDLGWTAMAGTELEFIVYRDTYEQAWAKGYQGLVPANLYNVDYSILGTSRVEPLLLRIRTEMAGAGLEPESAKGECNLGQHEIAFRYSDALTTADNHAVYKLGAKEIASQEGMSLTFMAKVDEREGNSCHIHLSLRDGAGAPVMAGDRPGGISVVFEHFVAGLLATLRELTLFFAPNVNSYKRFRRDSFAPTTVAWGRDNRTCALRVVGNGSSLRVENRVPGGDVNPYLALAAMVAGGLHGVEHEMSLEPPVVGNAYASASASADALHIPPTLRDSYELFEKSSTARHAFGDEVVEHYCNMARVELEAYDSAVTDWERFRGFERL